MLAIKKNKLRGILKRLAEASGKIIQRLLIEYRDQLDKLIQTDELIITAFDDVRGNIIANISQGHTVMILANSFTRLF